MLIKTNSEAETIELATRLADKIPSRAVLLLQGTLGMGKSVFARALIQAMSQDPERDVPSPTFTLVQTYDTPKAPLFHFDLYRLKDPEELYEIGWEEALSEGISLVEWPERLGYLTPKTAIRISIESGTTATERLITIEGLPE